MTERSSPNGKSAACASIRSALKPHLAGCEVDLRPRMIPTNRRLGVRGGAVSFARFKRDTAALMNLLAEKERLKGKVQMIYFW